MGCQHSALPHRWGSTTLPPQHARTSMSHTCTPQHYTLTRTSISHACTHAHMHTHACMHAHMHTHARTPPTSTSCILWAGIFDSAFLSLATGVMLVAAAIAINELKLFSLTHSRATSIKNSSTFALCFFSDCSEGRGVEGRGGEREGRGEGGEREAGEREGRGGEREGRGRAGEGRGGEGREGEGRREAIPHEIGYLEAAGSQITAVRSQQSDDSSQITAVRSQQSDDSSQITAQWWLGCHPVHVNCKQKLAYSLCIYPWQPTD